MKITLRLIAIGHADASAPGDGNRELDLAEPASVQQALDHSGLAGADKYMTLLNDEAIAKADRATTMLGDGDTVTIFPPIQGG